MWGVPVDHKVFGEISDSQWMWYFYNFLKDQEEEFEGQRDFVEYHASFMEPQIVKKIKEEREGRSSKDVVQVGDEDFMKGLKDTFGREVDFDQAKEENKNRDKENLNKALNMVSRR